MTDLELFQNKNPEAPIEYCGLAAALYKTLLEQDAFEHGVHIEAFHASFSFLFPNGRILIASSTPHYGMKALPCCLSYKNGTPCSLTHFTIRQVASWLQDNWDDLIKAV